MNTSRLIILGVAVTTAVGAGYVAMQMSAPPPQVIVENVPVAPAIEMTDVLIVQRDMGVGGVIQDQLSWQAWPKDGVREGFITKDAEPEALNAFIGAVARLPMFAGEPLRRSKLIDAGQAFMSSILPSGKRAIATQISPDTSAGGFILPNDKVDVIMTRRSTDSANEGFVTETILENIRVLAIDQTIREDEEGRKVKVGETATLELTPQQAQIITVAQQMADRLTLALRATVDAEEETGPGAEYLVSGDGNRGTVRMIKSGEISEVGARK